MMRRGLLYMVSSAFLFALMAVMVKHLPRIPTQEIVFVRSALNVAFTLFLIRRYRAPLLGNHKATLFMRGLFGYFSLSLHFFALSHLALADAVVVHNTSPLLVALMAPVFLGERGGGARVLALSAVGLAGVALIVRPTGEVGLAPGLAAVGGALMSSCAYVTIRGIGRSEHPLTVVLYFPMVSVLLALLPTVRGFVPPDVREALLLLAIGVTTTAAQICLTASLQLERAAVATAMSYTSVLFAALFGAIFFGEVPGGRTLAGAALIVGAALLIAAFRPAEGPPGETPAKVAPPV